MSVDQCEHNCEIDGNIIEDPLPVWPFRPRGSLARALYERQKQDEYLSSIDKNLWYQVNLHHLPESTASKFIQLSPDESTQNFLEQSEEKSVQLFTNLWHAVVQFFFGFFMTQTSINGMLQRGSMFVVSTSQFQKLLNINDVWRADSLLDLGAGDGEVTKHFSMHFNKIYATEVSYTMRKLLRNKGIEVLEINNWHEKRKFDMISCLNLIDRCDAPMTLLKQIRSALKPDGRVLLAVVLPFSAYVESGYLKHQPKELLPIVGETFEEQVQSTIDHVIKPAKFEVVSWSRVPYLCEGNLSQAFCWLDDVIFVLKLAEEVDD